MRSRRHLASSALTLSALLLVSGCSTATSAGEGAETSFVFPIPENPATFNPALSTDPSVAVVLASIYEPLTQVGGTYEVTPVLAEEWSVSDDGMEYVFTLRPDVKWHDGEDFTADDVKFNFENVMPLHPFGMRIADNVKSVEVVDPLTVRVQMERPYGLLVEALSSQLMLPEHIFAGVDIATEGKDVTPVGTGPFSFESFTTGQHVVVVKNEEYWRELGGVDRVAFAIMPDQNSRALALQSGEIDGIFSSFLNTASIVQAMNDPKLVWEQDRSAMPTVANLHFNVERGPLADPEVRKAIFSAIDRDGVATKALSGVATESRNMIPAAIDWAHDPQVDYRELFPYDPDAAAGRLDELGHPVDASGARFELDINVLATSPTAISAAEMLKANLEEIDVAVSLEVLDRQIYLDKVQVRGDFDLTIFEVSAWQDPSLGISRLYYCNPDRVPFTNPSGGCDPDLDAALNQAQEAVGRENRAAAFAEAQRLAAESLFSAPLAEAVPRSFVRNDEWGGLDGFMSVNNRDWASIGPLG